MVYVGADAGATAWIRDGAAVIDATGSASVARREDEVGRLAVGARGHLVVLTGDPLTVDPARLGDLEVDLTVVDGEVVYRRAGPTR